MYQIILLSRSFEHFRRALFYNSGERSANRCDVLIYKVIKNKVFLRRRP
jgi:hypothetical protein